MIINSLTVQDTVVQFQKKKQEVFICISDLCLQFGSRDILKHWLRNRRYIQFLANWEEKNNPNFLSDKVESFLTKARQASYVLSVEEWVSQTNAIGIFANTPDFDAIFTHTDIALFFCYWLDPTFQVRFIEELQNRSLVGKQAIDWQVKRIMAKASYPIQTDAIRQHLIPPKIKYTKQEGLYFANEADLLNIAVFGYSARQWKEQFPQAKGNLRDHASHEQLLVLSMLQGLNAKLLEWGSDKEQRLEILNQTAIDWMELIVQSSSLSKLPQTKRKLLD